jgi:hypothetical protein
MELIGNNYSHLLPVTKGVPLGGKDVILNIHPESHKQVDDDGGAHRKKRNIDKVFTNGSRCHSHFFTKIGANAKYMPFYELAETLHGR